MGFILPDYQTASLGELRAKISRLTDIGKPEQEFLFAAITEWLDSPKRKLMMTAQDYYYNDNNIKDRKRYYIDRKGNKQEVTNLSNNKLSHPYMRKLTNQKVNYLLSKEFTVDSDNDAFLEVLDHYFDKGFRRMLKNIGKDSVVNGLAWLQVYYDTTGSLKFKRIPPEEIIPFWYDVEHTVLDAVIRVYPVIQYGKSGSKKQVYKIEYHTVNGVWYYVLAEKGLKPDPEMGEELRGHFTVQEQGKDDAGNELVDEQGNPVYREVEATWNKVPFIAFKFNPDEISLLKWIKSLIDDYDLNTSDTSNNLQDVPNSIKVVRNYDGTDKGEFIQNLATFRTAFVANDGDMTTLSTPLDIGAVDSHLNRLRRDIYDAGNGVDTQDENLGAASGVSLRFRYAGLDMDAADMANEFSAALESLCWFIKTDLQATGQGDFMDADIDITFNTDIILNEAEVIAEAKNSVGILSDETIVANHPWTTDAQEELERIKAQKEQELQETIDMMAVQEGFAQEPQQGTDA